MDTFGEFRLVGYEYLLTWKWKGKHRESIFQKAHEAKTCMRLVAGSDVTIYVRRVTHWKVLDGELLEFDVGDTVEWRDGPHLRSGTVNDFFHGGMVSIKTATGTFTTVSALRLQKK